VSGAASYSIWQCLCLTIRGMVATPVHGSEAIAPAADSDAQPDMVGYRFVLDTTGSRRKWYLYPQWELLHGTNRPRCRSNTTLSHLFQTTLTSRSCPGDHLDAANVRCQCSWITTNSGVFAIHFSFSLLFCLTSPSFCNVSNH
jgi:hypothetical protein